ncbi:hypothetical protein AT15_06950 [Kosmotoga arenicorallina S304]|uniref:Fluoroacetyl-CoA-specific thioesterase-like domain-containing protein n=1 Tax=Kosmotoga arenicorallina S304 TaxID=1453497 RepID=A0A182C6Z6_9BACT|nr:hypothetical protein [Kosmotoga arenicorallina]OAA31229.1 hypothetical protein AT15_06950 [Kosmotoga arenicorallina S304]
MRLEELDGKQFTATLEIDNTDFLWKERSDIEGLNLLSTSGMQKLLLNFSREMLSSFESESEVFVVTFVKLEHLDIALIKRPLELNFTVNVKGKNVVFDGTAKQESNLVAKFTLVRRKVSLESIGRKLSEKA